MTNDFDPQVQTADESPSSESPSSRTNWARDVAAVVLLLSPAIAAVWWTPWFVTQDGLAHLYNAVILMDSFLGGTTFAEFYQVRWEPLPNWGGHVTLLGLLAFFPPWAADRLATTITLVGVGVAGIWLRGRVDGDQPPLAAWALASLSSMSFSWLMGFASFQLGVCLFAITLGVWWEGRRSLRRGRSFAIAALLAAGYFCHLVSLGLTVFALGFLAIVAPVSAGGDSRRVRLGKLALCHTPVYILGVIYLRLSREGGAMTPKFPQLQEFLNVSGWSGRLGWVDPISIAVKDVLPFTDRVESRFVVFSPILWLGLAILLLALDSLFGRRDSEARNGGDRRAWLGLGAVLLAIGVFGPDSMGPGHGDYLSQRIALLGLVALLPVITAVTKIGKVGEIALVVAFGLQTVSVWDYARYSQATAGRFAAATSEIGLGERVGTLLADVRTQFRINPALHADCWYGVERKAVVWSNYETRHYYFPVQFRDELDRPDSIELERIGLLGPEGGEDRVQRWTRLLAHHHKVIDVLVVWKVDPSLDVVTERWFEEVERTGDVRIFRPRPEL